MAVCVHCSSITTAYIYSVQLGPVLYAAWSIFALASLNMRCMSVFASSPVRNSYTSLLCESVVRGTTWDGWGWGGASGSDIVTVEQLLFFNPGIKRTSARASNPDMWRHSDADKSGSGSSRLRTWHRVHEFLLDQHLQKARENAHAVAHSRASALSPLVCSPLRVRSITRCTDTDTDTDACTGAGRASSPPAGPSGDSTSHARTHAPLRGGLCAPLVQKTAFFWKLEVCARNRGGNPS